MAFLSLIFPLTLVSYLGVFTPVEAATSPVAVPWSDSTYGPDGPWNAVEVTVGYNQKISLHPGREWGTYLLTTDYCNHNQTQACAATQAGTYNDAQSQLDDTGSNGLIQFSPGPDYMSGVTVKGANLVSWVDSIGIGDVIVPNVSLELVSNAYMAYPGGDWYPMSVGCLGIGAPDAVNQSFTTNSGPPINASLVPGWLWWQNEIASNSSSLHIGSANPPMGGSLYFGGYDSNRIVGDILNFQDDYTDKVTLKDISIDVIDGASPWEFGASLGGLLATGNSSIGPSGVQISVDGCSPYLSLPKSTCDAITSHLPVTYNEGLGLYLWDVTDPKYSQIVSSASALGFTFLGSSNKQNINISVPFRHLNLTLNAPLVENPQPYFPCYTGTDRYTLGRAFLQDAFVGANWGAKTWWLAQAPGPNIPSPSVVEIADGDTTIKSSSNGWKESWSGSWTALSAEEVGSQVGVSPTNAPTTPSSSVATPSPSSGSSALSTGAQAGIGVGAGLAGLAIIGAILFFFMRRRRRPQSEVEATTSTADNPSNVAHYGYHDPSKTPGTPGMAVSSGNSPSRHIPGETSDYAMYNQHQFQQHQRYLEPHSRAELPTTRIMPPELPGNATD
ncbi:acid protease [Xylariomycetidae sp. FL2044]|nr:acid protease [Xylariomycetidae sp. FL2044]